MPCKVLCKNREQNIFICNILHDLISDLPQYNFVLVTNKHIEHDIYSFNDMSSYVYATEMLFGFCNKNFFNFFSNPKCCLEGHKHTLLTDISFYYILCASFIL